jgi:hypothetical protein
MDEVMLIAKGVAFSIAFAILSLVIVRHVSSAAEPAVTGSWSCAADTLACADGTTVGRVPPYCHFASCAAT